MEEESLIAFLWKTGKEFTISTSYYSGLLLLYTTAVLIHLLIQVLDFTGYFVGYLIARVM